MKKSLDEMTPLEILEVCGPDWSKMNDAQRNAYGPRKTLRGRADRTRLLLRELADEWGLIEDAA